MYHRFEVHFGTLNLLWMQHLFIIYLSILKNEKYLNILVHEIVNVIIFHELF